MQPFWRHKRCSPSRDTRDKGCILSRDTRDAVFLETQGMRGPQGGNGPGGVPRTVAGHTNGAGSIIVHPTKAPADQRVTDIPF